LDLNFFKKPVYQITDNHTLDKSLKVLLSVLLYAYLFLSINYLFISAVDFIIKYEFKFSFLHLIDKLQDTQSKGYKNILYILILAPIFEELMFRLPLKFNRLNLLIAILTFYFSFYLSYNHFLESFWGLQLLKTILIVVLCWFIVFHVFKISFYKSVSTKYFGLLFYILAIIFGLLHITNFIEYVPNNLIFYSPIFAFHQIISGLFLGYIRVKKGLIWSIILHACFNLPAAIHYFLIL